MKKSIIAGCALALMVLTLSLPAHAATLQQKLSGRILLQIEEKGKAWYIDPATQNRAYLGRPTDAFRVMRELGLGITNSDLAKIASSDEQTAINTSFAKKLAGKILLQVQANGEAWYINPTNLKRYFLGRPSDAFTTMRGLGLGISNKDISTIPAAKKYTDPQQPIVKTQELPSNTPTAQIPSSSSLSSGTPSSTPPPSTGASTSASFAKVTGSYRCSSYNVSGGGGGDCRLFAPIVLNANGTYSVSGEKGTYAVKDDVITLSESTLRGPGKLLGGTQIRFEYDYNGWRHVITYLKESGDVSTPTSSGTEVSVQLILAYPAKDSALGGIVTVELVPEGQNITTASYKPTAIAQYDGEKRIIGSFYKATNMPRTGKKYTAYTNTGFASTAVGTLDLTNVKEELTVTINVTTGETKQSASDTPEGPEIVVEIDLVYPARDSVLGSIQFVVLVPEGGDPATAAYKPTALAVWDGDKTVVGSFHKATNRVKSKANYDVYADWGAFGGYVKSGTIDLTTTTTGPATKIIQTTISGSSSSSSNASSSSGSSSQQQTASSSASSSSSTSTYVSVDLILQYATGDSSLNNVTRIAMIKQGDAYYEGYSGEIAGYGASQQLTASFLNIIPGFLYDVYTQSYIAGSKKVGTVDMRGVTTNSAKTVSVQ